MQQIMTPNSTNTIKRNLTDDNDDDNDAKLRLSQREVDEVIFSQYKVIKKVLFLGKTVTDAFLVSFLFYLLLTRFLIRVDTLQMK